MANVPLPQLHQSSPFLPRHFYLTEMCVIPHRQGQEIGTTIIQTLYAELAAADVEKMYLLTARGGPAEDFYGKHGFYVSQRIVMMGKYSQE